MASMSNAGTMAQSCPEMATGTQSDDQLHDGLCLEHCQNDSKSADRVAPQIPAFLPVLIRQVVAEPMEALDTQSVLLAVVAPRAPPPPLSILNCCFRT